jgi:hypothetical protein
MRVGASLQMRGTLLELSSGSTRLISSRWSKQHSSIAAAQEGVARDVAALPGVALKGVAGSSRWEAV